MFVLFKLCLVPFLHVHPSRPYSRNFFVPEYSDIFMITGKPHFKGVSVIRIKYTIILNYFGFIFLLVVSVPSQGNIFRPYLSNHLLRQTNAHRPDTVSFCYLKDLYFSSWINMKHKFRRQSIMWVIIWWWYWLMDGCYDWHKDNGIYLQLTTNDHSLQATAIW